MSMLRNSTVKQLDRIEKEIKKQGGSLDLTNSVDHTGANGLWIHDPFEANRKGKRKIATIDDHMTIDIPESNKVLKFAEFNKLNENTYTEFNVGDCIETIYEYVDVPIGTYGVIVDIVYHDLYEVNIDDYVIALEYSVAKQDFKRVTDPDKLKECKKKQAINKFKI